MTDQHAAAPRPAKLTEKQLQLLEKKTKLPRNEITEWYKSFLDEYPNGQFDEKTYLAKFQQVLSGASFEPYFKYVFRGMDKNRDKIVDFNEFLLSVVVHSSGSWEEQLGEIFDIADTKEDNRLDAKELGDYLAAKSAYFGESQTERGMNVRQNATSIIGAFSKSDKNDISKEEFIDGCKRDPKTFESFFPHEFVCT